jgi:hypothetical protein
MHYLTKAFSIFFTGTITLSLNSCASSLANPTSSVSLPNSAIADASVVNQLDSKLSSPSKKLQEMPVVSQPLKAAHQAPKTTNINLYQVDNQCQGLVAKKVAIAANNSVDQAVEKVLNQTDSADFNLAGYRVKVEPKTKIATIDLRLPPKSKRQFASLSNCEQLALFGSLRKTLTSNPQLNIKDVRFTNQGTKISN